MSPNDEQPIETIYRLTVPVYVHVNAEGGVTRVVVDDERPSDPERVVRNHVEYTPWGPGDEEPATPQDRADYLRIEKGVWPAWEFSW